MSEITVVVINPYDFIEEVNCNIFVFFNSVRFYKLNRHLAS